MTVYREKLLSTSKLQFIYFLLLDFNLILKKNSTTINEQDSMYQDNDPENLRHKCIFSRFFSPFIYMLLFYFSGIHTYTINERLFATYVGDNGESICPVCKCSRKEPTSFSPQFCK